MLDFRFPDQTGTEVDLSEAVKESPYTALTTYRGYW